MWLKIVRICKQIGAFIRRLLSKEIVAADLAVGTYKCEVCERHQTVKNNIPYAYRAHVSKGNKSWVVISDKPFSYTYLIVVQDGATNKVV